MSSLNVTTTIPECDERFDHYHLRLTILPVYNRKGMLPLPKATNLI